VGELIGPGYGSNYGDPKAFTVANYFELPAISVPCGFDDNGLPVGLQFVGKPWDDAIVLSLADQFVATHEFAQPHPIP
jgi:aspartyl-tRNA(Asn)/glutamyl-tRNA(Gln) amidotransferase subunit A